MSYHIYGDEPMLHITVDGWEVFGMTLESVAPESREWLGEHLSERFTKVIAAAKQRGAEELRLEARRVLGIAP